MGLNFGSIAGNLAHSVASSVSPAVNAFLPNDLTPNANITRSAGGGIPFISHGNGSTGQAPAAAGNKSVAGVTGTNDGTSTTVANTGAYSGAASAQAAADAKAKADNDALLDAQIGNINSLLGRLDGGLGRGLQSLNDDYQGNVNVQNGKLNQAMNDYGEQRTSTTKDKQSAYNTINKNANNGYRSLAQIIGRASGTGSSAFQELLPDVVGKDTSGKRATANDTYGQNIRGIQKAEDQTKLSFQDILADLARQRQKGEGDLRSGVEGNRQNLLAQQQGLQGQRGNIGAAQALQPQIENSRNAVENFFSQFKAPIQAGQATVAQADLGKYNTDRSQINAQTQGAPDPTNPYSDLIRKRLQENTATV